jgi:hypothetical protein
LDCCQDEVDHLGKIILLRPTVASHQPADKVDHVSLLSAAAAKQPQPAAAVDQERTCLAERAGSGEACIRLFQPKSEQPGGYRQVKVFAWFATIKIERCWMLLINHGADCSQLPDNPVFAQYPPVSDLKEQFPFAVCMNRFDGDGPFFPVMNGQAGIARVDRGKRCKPILR